MSVKLGLKLGGVFNTRGFKLGLKLGGVFNTRSFERLGDGCISGRPCSLKVMVMKGRSFSKMRPCSSMMRPCSSKVMKGVESLKLFGVFNTQSFDKGVTSIGVMSVKLGLKLGGVFNTRSLKLGLKLAGVFNTRSFERL